MTRPLVRDSKQLPLALELDSLTTRPWRRRCQNDTCHTILLIFMYVFCVFACAPPPPSTPLFHIIYCKRLEPLRLGVSIHNDDDGDGGDDDNNNNNNNNNNNSMVVVIQDDSQIDLY